MVDGRWGWPTSISYSGQRSEPVEPSRSEKVWHGKLNAVVGLRMVAVTVKVAVRAALAVVAATFLVRAAIEISIDGGTRAVVLPNGINRSSNADLRVVERYRLDDNLVVRHAKWLGDVIQGDLGYSMDFRVDSVGELIVPRLSVTLELMVVSVVASVICGIGFGLLAVAWSGRMRGRVLTSVISLLQSMTVYVLPLWLLWFFAVGLRWLPAAGWVRPSTSILGNLQSLFLPALTLILIETGAIARIVYGDVSRVMQTDYVAAAFAKGLNRRQVLTRHALRPGSLGLLNVIGLNMGSLLAGTIIIELIFAIPGVGRLLLRAITNRDLHVLLALTGWYVLVYSLINGVVDLAMRLADPRLRRPSMVR